ncbi:hypothetical protein E1B28_001868 [Marasmius oreades]|uniref:Protein kinase domain-containing protein n=1 Tax=Marasmius oreades TaxID=181124 RepID=A0A9P7V4N0_9AGAR|nr:uncharacterized protein E1B28_001868 [Marasmius oreades]KAG7100087.1 hypothetical protein E1B28_001868 [Marasmius oreades]
MNLSTLSYRSRGLQKATEGTIDLLCSELLDIKFEENRAKHREWLDSLGDQGFEERIDVIAKRRKGEDPFKEIPIAILHPAFDRFLLGMHDPDLDIPPELYSEAVEFSSTCWQVFGSKNMDEPTKKAKKLQAIEKMLGYQLLKRTKEGAAFDGLLLVEGIYPALIFLSEDDIGVQLMGRCETLYSKCMRLASLDDVRKTISLPCFLVVVSGSHISVVGAACPSMHPSIEYLTGFYVCTSMPSDPGAVFENIAKLFACLRRSINVLTEYYKDLLSLLPCLPKRYLPLRNTFTTLDGQLKRINYSNLHMLGKNIWTGTVDTPDSSSVPVLVKFTRRYCAAAHNLLKSAGLAPKLYHYDFEPYQVEEDGNDVAPGLFYWRMIVMEYISNAVTLYDLTGTASDARQIAEHLRRAVDSLHMNNYVFGDLRPTNIMVQILEGKAHRHKGESEEEREIRVALVDFDWAGKDGKARYPSGISFGGTIAWPDGVKPRGLITKEHDLYWLRTWTDLLA